MLAWGSIGGYMFYANENAEKIIEAKKAKLRSIRKVQAEQLEERRNSEKAEA
jgi:hypothetical protein